MKKSFDHITGSWLYKTSKSIGDVVIISALFLLFCLPVVTIGSSVSALYYTVYRKYHKKSDTLSQDFMRSLKGNLKNGILIHVLYSVYLAIAGFNIYFAFNGLGSIKLPDWYTILSFLPLLPVIFTLPYIYPLMARFNNGIKGTVTNSFTLCMIGFPKFLLIWLILFITLAVSIVFPPIALVTPVAAAYLTQMITEKAFDAAMRVEIARDEAADDGQESVAEPEKKDTHGKDTGADTKEEENE